MPVLFAAKLIVWAYGLTVAAKAGSAEMVDMKLPKNRVIAFIGGEGIRDHIEVTERQALEVMASLKERAS